MSDLVEEHFASPEVRAAFIDAQDACDPRAPGSILAIAYFDCDLFTDPADVGIPHGGMGAITAAMARSSRAGGAEIRTGTPVTRILLRAGRAVGVQLADGKRIECDAVVSGADPKRTFLELPPSNSSSATAEASETRTGIPRLATGGGRWWQVEPPAPLPGLRTKHRRP